MATGYELVKQLKEEDTTKAEPALFTGVTAGAIFTVLYFIAKFFTPTPDEDLLNNIAIGIAFVLPLVVGWITRGKVWSPNSVQKVVDQSVSNVMKKSVSPNKPKENPDDTKFFNKRDI